MKTYRDPKTGKFCKKEGSSVVTTIGRDPKTGRFIKSSEPAPQENIVPVDAPLRISNDDINKLTDTIKTLENKLQELEKKLSGIELNYDTAIDWESCCEVVSVSGYRDGFTEELDILPYNTFIKIHGDICIYLYNGKDRNPVLHRRITRVNRVFPRNSGCYDVPSFDYTGNDNSEFILVPAFHRVKITVPADMSGSAERYACIGSKELRSKRTNSY